MTIAMPSSMVRTGTDLDGFAALLRPATAQVTVTGRGGPCAGHIVRMALRDLWLQRAVAGSAWINYAAISSSRLGILLGPELGPGAVWQGEPLAATEIAVRSPGQDYCIAVPAGSRWEAMSLPVETIARAFSVMMGIDPPSPNTSTIRTTPSAMAWLRMHRTRRALQNAHPAATVTEIAMSFGFWELGRFAIEYRRLFGESPSVTLRRARR